MATATYVPLATTTLSSTASSITLSSIPSGYTDLKIRLAFSLSVNADVYWRINGDSSANYSSTTVYDAFSGGAKTNGSNSRTNTNQIYFDDYGVTFANYPLLHTIDLFSYSGSIEKSFLSQRLQETNTSNNVVETLTGLWRSTAAVTSITYTISSGSFNVGTTLTIWGI